jgi:hypothetical protein
MVRIHRDIPQRHQNKHPTVISPRRQSSNEFSLDKYKSQLFDPAPHPYTSLVCNSPSTQKRELVSFLRCLAHRILLEVLGLLHLVEFLCTSWRRKQIIRNEKDKQIQTKYSAHLNSLNSQSVASGVTVPTCICKRVVGEHAGPFRSLIWIPYCCENSKLQDYPSCICTLEITCTRIREWIVHFVHPHKIVSFL